MTSSPFDHPALTGLFDLAGMGGQFSWEEDHALMLNVEAVLAHAQEAEGLIPQGAAAAISTACEIFAADLDELRAAVIRDGVVVPEFVRQLRATLPEEFASYVHFGATSQDIVDTSLMLRLRNGMSTFTDGFELLSAQFVSLEEQFGDNSLMGVTRMQEALPIIVADRLKSWRTPLERHAVRLNALSPRLLVLQLGGAVGTLDKMGGKGPAVAARMAEDLGLGLAEPWHTQRDGLAEFASWLSLVTGCLGKMGQDISLMALRGDAIKLAGGGGSSAMPHKQNPVDAEILVTLARFNATQLAGMHQSLVHEQERSGAAWTLEWMILPQMVMATSAALVRAGRLLSNVEQIGQTDPA